MKFLQSSMWRLHFTFMAVKCSEPKLKCNKMQHKRSQSRTKWRRIEENYLPWEVSSAICAPLHLWKRRERLNLCSLTREPQCNLYIKWIVSCWGIVWQLFKRKRVRVSGRRGLGNVSHSWNFDTVMIFVVVGWITKEIQKYFCDFKGIVKYSMLNGTVGEPNTLHVSSNPSIVCLLCADI